jgi:hypothetical protein
VDVAVLAEDLDGNKSALTAYSNITTASFSTTPGTPTGLVATIIPNGVRLTWAEVAIPDLDYYEIHESASTGFSISGTGAVGNGTCIAHARGATHERRFPAGTTYPLTRYYRVVAVRTSTTRGSASTQASATITGVASTDVIVGAVTQTDYDASSSGSSLTTSYATKASVSMTTIGGLVQLVASMLADIAVSTSGEGWIVFRIRNTTTGAVSNIAELRLPVGGIAAATISCHLQEQPAAGTYTWVLEARYNTGTGSFQEANASLAAAEYKR